MKRLVLMLCSIATACGSSASTTPDGGPGSADAGPGGGLALPATDHAFCVTLGADYKNDVGTMAVVGLPSLTVIQNLLPGAVAGDPVLRAYGGKLYVINRFSNSISVVDMTTWTVVSQFSTGASSNPQDIAVAGTNGYVVQYGGSQIQVWDLSAPDPSAPTAMIDLAADDPDGNPNANSIAIVGTTAYVTLDLLDANFTPEGPGEIAVIDTTSNTVSGTLTLNYADPFDFMLLDGTKLLVETDGDFSGTNGCLETIQTGVPSTVGSCLIQNSAFGGTISAFAMATDGSIYFAGSIFDSNFNQTAALYQVASDGTLVPGTLTPSTQLPTDVAFAPPGYLVYADGTAGGIRVYDTGSEHELTTAALNIGLGPVTANGMACFSR